MAGFGSTSDGQLLRSLDYPCTRRLRLRRLLAYHRRYSDEPIYNLMKENTRVFFHAEDFIKPVETGQWRKSAYYLMGFFPLLLDPPALPSVESRLLMFFHRFLMSLDDFAGGNIMSTCFISGWILKIYRDPVLLKYPYFANIVGDVLFLRSDRASASLNWPAIRKKAAQMMRAMVRDSPDLRDKLHPPRGPKDLYHVVPIQSSFRRHRAKDVRVKQPALALAQFILKTKKRVASIPTFSGYELVSSEKLMELLDKALKAGSGSIMEQRECFPLVQMLSKPPFNGKIPEIQGIRLAPAVPASRVTNSALKQKLKDAGHPENNSKRPQTSGRPGEDPSSRFGVFPGLTLLHSLDYPCTRRLRLRRLLGYHQRYTYQPIFNSMKERMHVIFHVVDFMKFVKMGMWHRATSYLIGFFSSDPISPEAKLLISFHKFLMLLNNFADGKIVVAFLISDWILDIYREPVLVKYPYFANLVADVLFLRSDHASASLNWLAVRKKAAEMMGDLVRETPELREKLDLPRGPKDLYHVVPIQSSFGRHRAKDVRIKQPTLALAQFFLQTQKRLPSSESQGTGHTFSEKTSSEQLMKLLDKALKAGSRMIFEQGRIPEHFNECFPLVQMLSKPPDYNKNLEIKAMKQKLEDASHPENSLKRQKISGSFGEASSRFAHPSTARKESV